MKQIPHSSIPWDAPEYGDSDVYLDGEQVYLVTAADAYIMDGAEAIVVGATLKNNGEKAYHEEHHGNDEQ